MSTNSTRRSTDEPRDYWGYETEDGETLGLFNGGVRVIGNIYENPELIEAQTA